MKQTPRNIVTESLSLTEDAARAILATLSANDGVTRSQALVTTLISTYAQYLLQVKHLPHSQLAATLTAVTDELVKRNISTKQQLTFAVSTILTQLHTPFDVQRAFAEACQSAPSQYYTPEEAPAAGIDLEDAGVDQKQAAMLHVLLKDAATAFDFDFIKRLLK